MPVKTSYRRGQTTVEYILLIGGVCFAVFAFKAVLLDNVFASVVPNAVNSIQNGGEASTGGVVTPAYYVKSKSVAQ